MTSEVLPQDRRRVAVRDHEFGSGDLFAHRRRTCHQAIGALIVKATGTGVEPATAAATTKTHAAHRALTAHLVVLGTLGLIANNVVGRGDFLELVFCCSVTGVGVGMKFPSQLPVRARDVLRCCRFRHTEDFVVVLVEPLALWSHFLTLDLHHRWA